MGLFNFGKQKREVFASTENFEVKKIKERSFMLAISKNPEEWKNVELLRDRIEKATFFKYI